MRSISLIIPIYNEEGNIRILYDEIKNSKAFNKINTIVFIDDNSSDNSWKVLENIKENSKKILLLKNNINSGQSFAINKGIQYSNDELIITMDGDCQNDPKDIIKLIELYFKNNDIKLVGGVRLNRKDKLNKIIASKIANYVRRIVLNDNCVDTGCSLKMFDRSVFLSLPYFDGMHRFLPALFNIYNQKTMFVSVDHRYRKYGISKYGNFIRLIKGLRDLIKVKKIMNNR